jgi:hypothetical protein
VSAAVAGAAAAAAHAAWGSHGWVRSALEGAGLVDVSAARRAERAAAAAQKAQAEKDAGAGADTGVPWPLSWLPIRRLTPEEAAAHKAAKEAAFRESVRAAGEGGLPAAVEKAGREEEGRRD